MCNANACLAMLPIYYNLAFHISCTLSVAYLIGIVWKAFKVFSFNCSFCTVQNSKYELKQIFISILTHLYFLLDINPVLNVFTEFLCFLILFFNNSMKSRACATFFFLYSSNKTFRILTVFFFFVPQINHHSLSPILFYIVAFLYTWWLVVLFHLWSQKQHDWNIFLLTYCSSSIVFSFFLNCEIMCNERYSSISIVYVHTRL